MFARFRRTPSFASVVAMLALFVALSGSAVAATSLIASAQVKDNSLQSRDIKNSSLTGTDVKNSSLTGTDVKDGSLSKSDFKAGDLPAGAQGTAGPQGAAGSQGAAGAQGLKGDKGDKGDPGDAGIKAAYGLVNADSSVDGSQSGGIISSMVSHPVNGRYCFKFLAGTPDSGTVTSRTIGRTASLFLDPDGVIPGCPVDATARVTMTKLSDGTDDDTAFYVAFMSVD